MIQMDIDPKLPVVELKFEEGEVTILEADEHPTGRNYRYLWSGDLREFLSELHVTKEDCEKAFEEKS